MAMAEKFNTARRPACRSPARVQLCKSKRAPLGRREVTTKLRCPVPINYLTYLHKILQPSDREAATDTEWSIIRTMLPTKPRGVAASPTGASSRHLSGLRHVELQTH